VKPISLQLYSVREQMKDDLAGTLKKVAELGYPAVEGGPPQGVAPEEFKKMLDDLGLRLSSSFYGLANEENVQAIVDYTALFGIQTLVAGYRREAWDTPDGIAEAAEALQASAERLQPHGIVQAYHNHWWELKDIDGRRGLEIFLEAAPDVHSELDVYWACRFGEVDVPALLRKWGTRCSLLHVKDGPLVEGEPHVAVGAGKMDIPGIVAAADEATLQWLIVELDQCGTDMMTAVGDSLEYLTSHGLGAGRA